MDFSEFFTNQARKPSGLFGTIVMSAVFSIGNAYLNKMVDETIEIKKNDHVLDIGCGTGNLIRRMANQISDAHIEGLDFSSTMVSIARNKNKKFINRGKVNIVEGDFDTQSFQNESFDKVCTVNTIYFWPNPEITAKKIFSILKPGGLAVVAFEDIGQLKKKKLNQEVFRSYKTETIKSLLFEAGFGTSTKILTKTKGKLKFHCVVAKKT